MILVATYIGAPLRNVIINSYGYLYSVYDKTLNLILSDKLVTLSVTEGSKGPFTINVKVPNNFSFKFLNLKEGSEASCLPGYLNVCGSTLRVITRYAKLYNPSMKISLSDKDTLDENIEIIKKLILEEGSSEGIRDILKIMNDHKLPRSPSRSISNITVFRALTCTQGLISAIKQGDKTAIRRNLKHLIGLGPGTTPSCDDMLCGILLVLRTFAVLNQNLLDITEFVCNSARNLSVGKTTRVSEEYILYASNGLANEVSKSAVEALFLQSGRLLKSKFRRLLDIGESSGTDIATGIVLGAELCKAISIESLGDRNEL